MAVVMHASLPYARPHPLLTRVPNRPFGLTSFEAPLRRQERVNSLFALGRPGPRIESLGSVQGDCRSQRRLPLAEVYSRPITRPATRPSLPYPKQGAHTTPPTLFNLF
jgi:hypothetical protein